MVLARKKVIALLAALVLACGFMLVAIQSAWAAEDNCLTFTAQETNPSLSDDEDTSTVTLNIANADAVWSRMNDGEWSPYTPGSSITLKRGETLSFKGTNVVTNRTNHFVMTGSLAASGDVTSLTNGVGGDAELGARCYDSLFCDCDALTSAPNLPSTSLNEGCYEAMFANTSITEAPALPATTLAKACYAYMFSGCTTLTETPALPATTLVELCYVKMFFMCEGLTVPADMYHVTTIPNNSYCCSGMYSACMNLQVYSDASVEGYKRPWLATSATGAENWASECLTDGYESFAMFFPSGGTFWDAPTAGGTYYIKNTTPVATNFIFTAPSNLVYDGNEKEAIVAPKTGIAGMGQITVNYYSDDTKLSGAPKDPGTYTVKIDVAQSDGYYAATDLTDDSWTFTITKAQGKDDGNAGETKTIPATGDNAAPLIFSVLGITALGIACLMAMRKRTAEVK